MNVSKQWGAERKNRTPLTPPLPIFLTPLTIENPKVPLDIIPNSQTNHSLPLTPIMAILTPTLLLRTLSLFHLTCSYYLLTSPPTLSDHNLVYILSASMDLPPSPPSLALPSSALALASLFLALLGIADFSATGLDEEVANHYWSAQAPVRLGFFFAVTGFSYVWKEGGVMGGGGKGSGSGNGGMRGLVSNGFVFTWGFVEMMAWFWVSEVFLILG